MAYVRYDSIDVHESGGLTFTCSFWRDQAAFDAGARPLVVNDFVMPVLRPTQRKRTRRESDGFAQKSDGTWVDEETLTEEDWATFEWNHTDYPVDIRGKMRKAVSRFIQRFTSWSADKKRAYSGRDSQIVRKLDTEDTHDVLTVDVKNLRGTREVA